jgi:hypothetical protein
MIRPVIVEVLKDCDPSCFGIADSDRDGLIGYINSEWYGEECPEEISEHLL